MFERTVLEIKCYSSSFACRGSAFSIVHPVIQLCLLGLVLILSTPAHAQQVFDMRAIIDPDTLEIDVVQPWRTVQGPVVTRQKLVTINVGEIWPGQDYRVPVRMVVPADRKAHGFHLTGGNSPVNLQREMRPRGTNLELLRVAWDW